MLEQCILGRGNSKCEEPKTGRHEALSRDRKACGRERLGDKDGGVPAGHVGTSGLGCRDWVLF